MCVWIMNETLRRKNTLKISPRKMHAFIKTNDNANTVLFDKYPSVTYFRTKIKFDLFTLHTKYSIKSNNNDHYSQWSFSYAYTNVNKIKSLTLLILCSRES